MKRNLLLILLLILSCIPVKAIDWEEVITPLGKTAYVDKDSITEYNNYYFYNIKVYNDSIRDYSVITIQSGKNKPFSARINSYKTDEYESLNGDYDNITSNFTKDMEPVTSYSVVNSCYKRVKQIKNLANSPISF